MTAPGEPPLQRARRQVTEAEANVDRLKTLIAQLGEQDHNTATAKAVLATCESMLAGKRAHLRTLQNEPDAL